MVQAKTHFEVRDKGKENGIFYRVQGIGFRV